MLLDHLLRRYSSRTFVLVFEKTWFLNLFSFIVFDSFWFSKHFGAKDKFCFKQHLFLISCEV